MSKRKTPDQRIAEAAIAACKARRDGIQAQLDSYAAIAESRKWPRRECAAIRHVLAHCDLFERDLEQAEAEMRAIGQMLGTDRPVPLASPVEAAQAVRG